MPVTKSQFRRELQRITTGSSAETWPPAIEALRADYPHTVREVAAGARQFNCFAFALGLHDSVNYFRVAANSEEPNVFADTPFVHRLVDSKFLVQSVRSAVATQLIIYSMRAVFTHAGVSSDGRVTSKWGTGQYFEHAIDEVPANYGDHFAFFEQPRGDRVEVEFLSYAESQGVPVADFVAEWRAV